MVDVLIADDHALIREGLKKILKNGNILQVVAEACNVVEMMKKLENTKVDVIVLDISMPGMSGLEAIKEIKRYYPKIPILILSIHPEERFALRAIRAGASGYITKHCATDELTKAIEMVHHKQKYISKKLTQRLLYELGESEKKEAYEYLSDREFEILIKIALGEGAQKISNELNIATSTVNTYRQRILEKLNLSSTAELIRYAIEHKLID